MADIEAWLKKAKPRETTVPICLAGDVVAEAERLERQLADAGGGTWTADSLAATNPAAALVERIEAARKKIKASEVEFRFRALPDWSDDPAVTTWSDLLAKHPGGPDQLFDPETFPRALVAACAIDPVMSADQVNRLFAVLNEGQREALFNGAYSVNKEGTTVPFSLNASAILAGLGDAK